MLKAIFLSCVIVCVGVSSASAGKLKGKVIKSGDAGVSLSTYAADGQNPIYQGTGTVGSNPLYKGNERITPDGFSNAGFPAVNAAGVIAFQSVTDSPDSSGIFVRPAGGGTVITVSGSGFRDASGAPVINAGGQVAFKDGGIVILGNGGPVVRLYTPAPGGSVPITIFGSDFGVRGTPTINDAGDACVEGVVPGTTANALFVRPAGGGQVITIRGSDFSANATLASPQLVGRRLTATGTYSDGTSQILTYTLAADGSVSGVGPIKWMAPESIRNRLQSSLLPGGTSAGGDLMAICDDDSIRICGTTDHFFAALPDTGPNAGPSTPITTDTILRVGDSLDGSTVTGLSLAPQSWVDESNLTIYASLANGNAGLYVYTLPEPATLAAVLMATPLLRRRRR